MVRNASYAVAFTSGVPSHRSKICVEFRAYRIPDDRCAIFCAEDDVDEQVGERLRHTERIDRTYSALHSRGHVTQGFTLGYDEAAPSGLVLCANTRLYLPFNMVATQNLYKA